VAQLRSGLAKCRGDRGDCAHHLLAGIAVEVRRAGLSAAPRLKSNVGERFAR
jgi:hypothetical protein